METSLPFDTEFGDDWQYFARIDVWVHEGARIGLGCRFGRGVIVHDGVEIGASAQIGSNVRLSERVRLGAGCQVMDGTVIYPDTWAGADNRFLECSHLGKGPEVAGAITRKLKPEYPPLTIGDGCLIGPFARVYRGTTVGNRVSIYEYVTIREECTIADEVVLAPSVTVNYQTRIGKRTRVMHATHLTGGMVIEDDVFISLHVGSTNDSMIEAIAADGREWKGATIRSGAVIGAGTMLSPSVEVGCGAHVGMQSVVTRDIPPFTLAIGAPARVVKALQAGPFHQVDQISVNP